MANQPALVRTTFLCLWSMADDEGRLEGDAIAVWRFGSFREDSREVAKALGTLASIGRILIYEVEGNPYMQVVHFNRHQRIDHPTKSKYPEYSNGHDLFSDGSKNPREDSRKLAPDLDLDLGAGIKEQGGPPPPKPVDNFTPTTATREWAEKRGLAITWEAHLDYFRNYLAQGHKYKDRDAAFRNCLTSDWGGLRKQTGARTVHGAAQREQPPCGNCTKPITGAWSQSPKGRVCDPCWKHYHREGKWN